MRIPLSRTLNQVTHAAYRQWKLQQSGWHFTKYRANMYVLEYPEWTKYYTPKGNSFTMGIYGKKVLDIGAGEGETAKFFFDKGAYHVTAIEPDPEAYKLLKQNAWTRQLKPINEPFCLKQIEEAYTYIDLIKIDIEGYEEELLQLPCPKTPIIAEVHGLQLADKFRKAGYQVETPSRHGCLSYAYWKCLPQ